MPEFLVRLNMAHTTKKKKPWTLHKVHSFNTQLMYSPKSPKMVTWSWSSQSLSKCTALCLYCSPCLVIIELNLMDTYLIPHVWCQVQCLSGSLLVPPPTHTHRSQWSFLQFLRKRSWTCELYWTFCRLWLPCGTRQCIQFVICRIVQVGKKN